MKAHTHLSPVTDHQQVSPGHTNLCIHVCRLTPGAQTQASGPGSRSGRRRGLVSSLLEGLNGERLHSLTEERHIWREQHLQLKLVTAPAVAEAENMLRSLRSPCVHLPYAQSSIYKYRYTSLNCMISCGESAITLQETLTLSVTVSGRAHPNCSAARLVHCFPVSPASHPSTPSFAT